MHMSQKTSNLPDKKDFIVITESRNGMTKDTLRNEIDALAYLTECTLATVSDLVSRARPPKGELQRQISIAQVGIDWVKLHAKPGMKYGLGRVRDIIDGDMSVADWAETRR